MKRRQFGWFIGAGLAGALPALRQAQAQPAPDPSLLATTLTPLGAERAGNADGTIPAWTGGVVSPPLPPDQSVEIAMFDDEQPLYTVDAGNMAQYASLLSAGTQALMTKYGLKIRVFQTHRTAAVPQYVADNTAQNVARARLEAAGGRFGFTGAYAGTPFPILDTADPYTAGAQVIWNHLVQWLGHSHWSKFSPGFVITNGHAVLTFGGSVRFVCPYYDPQGKVENYAGYYTKEHAYFLAPAASNGGEAIVWTSSNTYELPDITWSLLNGQGRVRKAPDEAYDTPNPSANGINNYDDASGFAGSPQKYDWKLIGKQEMLIPYNCNAIALSNGQALVGPAFPNPDLIRWEKHRVWVVEAMLHPGERNTTKRRMCYMDEDTWMIVLTDMYDVDDSMVKTGTVYNSCLPSLPGTLQSAQAFWQIATGDYTFIGNCRYAPYSDDLYLAPQNPQLFDPQQMAASASF